MGGEYVMRMMMGRIRRKFADWEDRVVCFVHLFYSFREETRRGGLCRTRTCDPFFSSVYMCERQKSKFKIHLLSGNEGEEE